MRITLASVFVDDQAKALAFYTDVLGFEKATDIPMGEFRWLSVASPQGPEGVELVLEPNHLPAAKTFQEAIKAAGIPATSFASTDVQAEHDRLVAKGVTFTMQPTPAGPTVMAVFDDTCGNLIQMHQG